MLLSVTLVALASLQAAPSGAEAAKPVEIIEGAENAAPEKVTDKSHPDYVRCKRESVIGSRAKKRRVCMTNKEWALVERRGNEASKEYAGDNFAAGYY